MLQIQCLKTNQFFVGSVRFRWADRWSWFGLGSEPTEPMVRTNGLEPMVPIGSGTNTLKPMVPFGSAKFVTFVFFLIFKNGYVDQNAL